MSWPVTTRDDWERIKAERLQPTLEGRLPEQWPQLLAEYPNRTYPLAIAGRHGFYGTPRYLLGDERVLTMYYDDPSLIGPAFVGTCSGGRPCPPVRSAIVQSAVSGGWSG